MNVKFSSLRMVVVALGLFRRGSGAWYGGLSEVPGFGLGCRVAYPREKERTEEIRLFMVAVVALSV